MKFIIRANRRLNQFDLLGKFLICLKMLVEVTCNSSIRVDNWTLKSQKINDAVPKQIKTFSSFVSVPSKSVIQLAGQRGRF